MKRFLHYRTFASLVMSLTLGSYAFRHYAFPDDNSLLRMILLQKPYLFHAIKFSFTLMLFTTPFLIVSVIFSLAYIFGVSRKGEIGTQPLPKYPDPRARDELYLVVGEVHHPKRPEPVRTPAGSSSPTGDCSPALPSSAPLEPARLAVACTRLRTDLAYARSGYNAPGRRPHA